MLVLSLELVEELSFAELTVASKAGSLGDAGELELRSTGDLTVGSTVVEGLLGVRSCGMGAEGVDEAVESAGTAPALTSAAGAVAGADIFGSAISGVVVF